MMAALSPTYDIDVSNNIYTSDNSMLNLISPEMHNGTVKCINDTLNATSVLVGAYTLILATGIHAKDIRLVILSQRYSYCKVLNKLS